MNFVLGDPARPDTIRAMRRSIARHLLRQAALTAVYLAAGRLGLSLAFVNESASAVWPPTGIALAAILLLGRGMAPAIFAGAFLVNLTTSGAVLASLGIAVGNTLEALAGAWLANRYAGGTRAFDRADDTFRFVGVAALATSLSASIGLLSLVLAGRAAAGEYGAIWLTWWLGDASGAILVTPLIVLWSRPPHPDPLRARPVEAVLLGAATVGLALIVFGAGSPAGRSQFPLAFLCLPGLLWAAFRFGPREAATCSAALAGIAASGTLGGYGPYAVHGPGQGLLMLQTFIGIVTTASIAAAAEAQQRRLRESELRALNAELEDRVARRTRDLQQAHERLAEAREAEEANRLKDQFLATLSHELRTPLHAVLGWAQMLLQGALDGDRERRAVELIFRNAVLQSQMISDLLDVSRITAGTLTLEARVVDVCAVLEAAVEAARPAAIEKRLTIEMALGPPAWVTGDPNRLTQVANNLLGNAIKFTPADGRITIRTARAAGHVEIQVEDTGPGIDAAFLPHVFDRFRQQDATVTRQHGGLGLGLALVKHITELHGGEVRAGNRPGGTGAVFTLTLPTVEEEAPVPL